MTKSKVFWTDFRTKAFGEGLTAKLQKLCKKAGISKIDMKGKFVAIKMHFGEKGNLSFLRPNYARAVVDMVKEMGGIPFLTDCNTMYPGARKHAIEHLECAWENGFTPYTVGCPVIIADGIKGNDSMTVPIKNGEMLKEAYIGRAIMDADIIISLTHFKGHEQTGFGGCIKNIGMGSGSRQGKCAQHSSGQPKIDQKKCVGCKMCQKQCANNGLVYDTKKKKMTVDKNACMGCGRCLGACNVDAISFESYSAGKDLNKKMAEYTMAVVDGRPQFHISLICDVSPNCDCHPENDAPIIPDVGMFCSFDAVAIDRACVDMCLKQKTFDNTQLTDRKMKGSLDKHDHFCNANPGTEWRSCLEHAEKIGIGTQKYELIKMEN
ncbi:MAG: DUF362 domain-containing protein [Lachnospiraceae bacterium]|nr:DUF362 domain-containing protein [Lachnospiraceae bacterium]